jgi:tRNA(Ile)-lysidine synthase
MNFFKGTGIRGLHGMKPRNGNVIRPLLFARKQELIRYAKLHAISYVEDRSNASDDYTRNFFRNRVLPLIEKVFPAVSENLLDNIRRFSDIAPLYEEAVQRRMKRLVIHKGKELIIPVRALAGQKARATVLYEIIRSYGFHASQVDQALSLLPSESGKFIQSPTHRLLKDRERLILTPLTFQDSAHILINTPDDPVVFSAGTLSFRMQDVPADSVPDSDAGSAFLDARHIAFPLVLRPWRTGDYFYPLGMAHKKKLSRFFIDRKLSLAEKERVWVLEMDRKIIWVVGMRIDNRFRVTPSTRNVTCIRFRNGDASAGK